MAEKDRLRPCLADMPKWPAKRASEKAKSDHLFGQTRKPALQRRGPFDPETFSPARVNQGLQKKFRSRKMAKTANPV